MVLTAIFSVLFVFLGLWQLDRAEQKTAVLQKVLERSRIAPLESLDSNTNIDSLIWRKAVLAGSFVPTHTFLLDNQVVKGMTGYFAYSPFVLDSNITVLVNRGWLKAGARRDQIPQFITPQGRLQISGKIKAPPKTGRLLAENTDEIVSAKVYRLQHLDPEKLNKKYGLKLLPYVIRLDSESPAGFERAWTEPASGKEKHLGYAFQWFAMTAALLIIFITVNLNKANEHGEH